MARLGDESGDFVKELKKQAKSVQHEGKDKQAAKEYVDADGTVFEWDEERHGWFPKVDEDFLAAYQLNYGVPTSQESQDTAETTISEPAPQPASVTDLSRDVKEGGTPLEEAERKKRKAKQPAWFEMDSERNTNVYVSGLPLDLKEEEFVELMNKYGIIMEDSDTKKPKVKLYKDQDGNLKGDGRCCYLKVESVALAIQMLDETDYKGNQLTVQQAEFQLKGKYNPALKKKKKKNKKKKQSQAQSKLLDWVDRDEKRPKCERILIFKNMFNNADFEPHQKYYITQYEELGFSKLTLKNPALVTELRNDLKNECEKFGEVKKVMVFDRNTEGVCSVAFKEFHSAEACVPVMNGRWFAGKQISVATWDGKTSYRVEETDEQREERLKKWGKYLFDEMDEEEEEPATTTS